MLYDIAIDLEQSPRYQGNKREAERSIVVHIHAPTEELACFAAITSVMTESMHGRQIAAVRPLN